MNFARDIRRQLDGESVCGGGGVTFFLNLHWAGVFTHNIERQLPGECMEHGPDCVVERQRVKTNMTFASSSISIYMTSSPGLMHVLAHPLTRHPTASLMQVW